MATATGRGSRPSTCSTTGSFLCAVHASSALASCRRRQDLAGFTLLRSDDEPWKPWFDAAGLDWPEPSRGPIFNDSSLMLQAAAEGQGVALARGSLLGHDIRNGVLVRLFDVTAPAPRKFWLVYPPRMADSPKLATFRKWLHDEIALEGHDAPRVSPRAGKRRSGGGGAAARRP